MAVTSTPSARLGEIPEPGSRHHKPSKRPGCTSNVAVLTVVAVALYLIKKGRP